MAKMKLPYGRKMIDIEIDDKNLACVLESKAGKYKTELSQEEIVEKSVGQSNRISKTRGTCTGKKEYGYNK
jgi:lactate racemase